MTVTEQLAPILNRTISDNDRRRAALLLLDWTGCAIAGQAEAAGQKITTAFPDDVGNCTRIGASKSSVLMAALHNGCLGNVLEMDDVDKRAVLHAGPTVIPAALAMAEATNASAQAFLDAIVIGYEATIRIGRAVGPGHYAFWHNTATCGAFGAAAAACYLLEESDLVSALGLAGTQAAGLWQTRHEPDSMAKQLHAGHAAHAGVLAAILSKQDFQGPRSILEGEQGFFAAMCPRADPEDVLVNPDAGWLLHETSLKPYPACRHAHPAIDAVLAVRENLNMPSDEKIVIKTYSDAIKFCDRPHPKTTIDAKFSIQHSAAVAIKNGSVALEDFTLESINDIKYKSIRDRIVVELDQDFEDVYPAHYGARVKSGLTYNFVNDAYGDPEKPMSDIAVLSKTVTLMVHAGLAKTKSHRISKAILSLSKNGMFSDYTDLLP